MTSPLHALTHIPPSKATVDFEELYQEHFAFVWRCLRALGVSEANLDDVCQEVFLVVHRRLADYRGEGKPRTWVYGILRNVASNHRRTLRRRGENGALEQEPQSEGSGPLDRVLLQEDAAFLEAFLESVTAAKREVFALALIEQLSIPEVAEILGVPVNTAYTRLRNVRLDFQRALAQRSRG